LSSGTNATFQTGLNAMEVFSAQWGLKAKKKESEELKNALSSIWRPGREGREGVRGTLPWLVFGWGTFLDSDSAAADEKKGKWKKKTT